ncbi:MAG TPA: aldehyde ferredoxin oxidoreductase C-terminal domain-containing protein [Candidatus Sumerlaeota bacterium]|nr:aldehyde ferredoxin oxidoreductase C-terminal domain-containing protein [Candidatus Sumerlaeota bacterium]
MYGWTGAILHVDLRDGTHWVEHPDAELYRTWIGGKALAACYLAPSATLPWNDPAMPIIWMTGPLTATPSPSSGHVTVMTRSPLTGTVGDATLGGEWGTQLKRAGYDGLIVRGRAHHPCGIVIQDGEIEIQDARGLVGLRTSDLAAHLKPLGPFVAVGPAATRGVRFASLVMDGPVTVGRNGLGLALSAHNLQFVSVRGTGIVSVADPAGLEKASEDIQRLVAATPALLGEYGIGRYGSGAFYDLMVSRRMLPTANFRKTYFAEWRKVNACTGIQRFKPESVGCAGCSLLCQKAIGDGRFLPGFEPLAQFTALLENDDLDICLEACEICAEMGMDPLSAAGTLATYAESQGRRLEGEEILDLLYQISVGHGVGVDLARGSLSYSEQHEVPQFSMTVKGQEIPPYDPRGACGMALSYATSTRGACHLRAFPISHEILRKPVATDRFSFEGKARIIKIAEDACAAADSLTICKFLMLGCSLEECARSFTAVTGLETTAQDLLRVGERASYLERILNARNGFTAKDDTLPARFFEESGSSGNQIEVPPLDREVFRQSLANYYRVRGLDADGQPTLQGAAALGLDLHS